MQVQQQQEPQYLTTEVETIETIYHVQQQQGVQQVQQIQALQLRPQSQVKQQSEQLQQMNDKEYIDICGRRSVATYHVGASYTARGITMEQQCISHSSFGS